MTIRPLCKAILALLCVLSYQAKSLEEGPKYGTSAKVRPKGYYLNLKVSPYEKTFSGEVIITVVWFDSANEITFNVHKNLSLENVEVFRIPYDSESEEELLKLTKARNQKGTNLFNIILDETFDTGAECAIKISFSGKLNTDDTKGLFLKTYVDATTGQSKWIIASDFKPNYASTVFPCFDDPAIKVPIEVNIQRPANTSSLSTMPLMSSEDFEDGWFKDAFATSPPMSTFSLAIFISDLNPIEYQKEGVQMGIWPAPELLPTIKENRSEVLFSSIRMFSEYFGVNYPLPKIDYIALPKSAEINILSSWGLIVSSNNNLGYKPAEEKWVISSEVIEQWMGNLVTPYSWAEEKNVTNLISFSTDFNIVRILTSEDKNAVPEWLTIVIYANYYELANPISSESATIRKSVSDFKAQMVYRMLTYTLTERTYLAALQKFIRQRQFKTYSIADFWDALTKQAHADGNLPNYLTVKGVITSWIEHYRLPFVTVTRSYNTSSVLFTQRPFLRLRPKGTLENEAILWKIPIVYVSQGRLDFSDTKPAYWMINRDFNVKNIGDTNHFIIVNPEEIASYVVNYDTTNWNMLATFLQSDERNKIPVITRAKLIHDALNLAYAGYLDFGIALNMTLYLKDEREVVAWRPFTNLFDHIGRHIDGTSARQKLETYVRMLITPIYKQLNEDKENLDKASLNLLKELKPTLRSTDYQPTFEEAKIEYSKWMRNPLNSSEATEKYFCTIFKYGTQEQWEFGLKTLLNALRKKTQINSRYLLNTLVGCTRDHRKIKKMLTLVIFDQNDIFTNGDISFVLSMLTGGADGYMTTFEFLKDNWRDLKSRFQRTPKIWTELVYTATNLHKSEEGLEKVTELYSKYRGQFGEAEEVIKDSLIKIKEEVLWMNQNLKTLEDWLDNYIQSHSLLN